MMRPGMPRPIGYYVHHHGDGHRQRALAIAAHAQGRIVLLGTGLAGRTGDIACVDLPDDRLPDRAFDGVDATHRPHALHYAPLDHKGIRRRVAAISAWIADARPALMVVDVSVEIAMLARLASVPTVYVRLAGDRSDAAHREAFRGAEALLAPFHPLLDDDGTDAEVRLHTIYAPGLIPAPPAVRIETDVVLGVIGRGGTEIDGEAWASAARATPDRRWRVIGTCTPPPDIPANLSFAGWMNDSAHEIAAAGVVVGGAGDGLVGQIIAARKPFVCIPEDRPFGEQKSKAGRLAALGAAVVVPRWQEGAEWNSLLDRALAVDPAALAGLDDAHGSARTAGTLLAIADRMAPVRSQAA